jgi:hypothetical protein
MEDTKETEEKETFQEQRMILESGLMMRQSKEKLISFCERET